MDKKICFVFCVVKFTFRQKRKKCEPKLRIELRTSSLQDWCSTSKLFGLGLLRGKKGNYKNM